MSKIPVTFANWKMNKILAEAEDYFRRFLPRAGKYTGKVEIFLLCIGESHEQRKSGGTRRVIKEQMDVICRDFSAEDMVRNQILYEPLWAIGAEEPASPVEAQEAQRTIRGEISKGFGEQVAREVNPLRGECSMEKRYGFLDPGGY